MLKRFALFSLAVIPMISACSGPDQSGEEAPAPPGLPAMISFHGQELETRMVEVESNFIDPERDRVLLGRGMIDEDFEANVRSVVVLSRRLWQDLGGRPEILGEHISLAGENMRIIGVLAPGSPLEDESIAWTPKGAGAIAP